MHEKTAAIVGATGVVGSYLLEALLNDDYFSTVRVIVRRPYASNDPKTEVKLVDFDDAESVKLALEGAGAIFCCVGTTMKKVKGDKTRYRKVDFDIPARTARFGKEAGCEKYIVVSAIGADSQSRNFYLQLKGEMEEAVRKSDISSVHIMRPSLIMGERKEYRLGEKIAKVLMPLFNPFLPSRYKSIHAREIARAMLACAKKKDKGVFVHEYKEMKELNKQTYQHLND